MVARENTNKDRNRSTTDTVTLITHLIDILSVSKQQNVVYFLSAVRRESNGADTGLAVHKNWSGATPPVVVDIRGRSKNVNTQSTAKSVRSTVTPPVVVISTHVDTDGNQSLLTIPLYYPEILP